MQQFSESEKKHIALVKRNLMQRIYDWNSNYLTFAPYDTRKEFAGIHKDQLFLSGGAIASLIQGEEPKDFDIYSTVSFKGAFESAIVSDYYDEIKDIDHNYGGATVSDKAVTPQAISMKSSAQFILLHSGTPAEIKATFDFVHCTPHFSFADSKLYISRQQYDACLNKKLIINNQSEVKQRRIDKFAGRGYDVKEVYI